MALLFTSRVGPKWRTALGIHLHKKRMFLSAVLTGSMPRPDIKTEHARDGGLLMSAIEERFDPTDPEHLLRARILAEFLIAWTGNRR